VPFFPLPFLLFFSWPKQCQANFNCRRFHPVTLAIGYRQQFPKRVPLWGHTAKPAQLAVIPPKFLYRVPT
jgi:hypothetical protein